jgi:sugar transferase EpsL
MRQQGWSFTAKRVVDVCLASTALIVGAPVLAAAALAVRVSMGPPVLFSQVRPGRGGRPFTVRKLRTMLPGSGNDGARLTSLGRFLRATSIDELPQLWNVLRGEMALVGPRPERPELVDEIARQLPFYEPRHLVRPGTTAAAHGLSRAVYPRAGAAA